ncbi:Crp/Fnr family transcriptional regulator, partial [uncultured Helicobacter sp.]
MKEKALRSIGAFANISEGSLESLEAITKLRYIEKNGILHYEGEYIESAYFLARGKVEVYEMDKNDNELFLCYVDSHLSDGRLINAFGTFAPYEANASVRGVEPSEIVLLDLQQLHQLVTKNIEISNAILSEVMNRMITFKNF